MRGGDSSAHTAKGKIMTEGQAKEMIELLKTIKNTLLWVAVAPLIAVLVIIFIRTF
jgi:hypothetical protein